jgi:hypothetical protein
LNDSTGATWLVTMPAARVMGALAEGSVEAFSDATVCVAVVGAVTSGLLAGVLMLARRHNNLTADNVLDGQPPSLPPATAVVAA